ncbi:E1-E2 ATPase-domain-containing protein [Zalerion maritima]|uniref:E1-E2 ATPase-domain-containing protein n=1 Tax=Zalerion maritima TaxID=339359 RepID=A0AAD5RTW7_9PEZI|nr:E1-E2 ATPase-domain-containing protein [Zalerion maritima]
MAEEGTTASGRTTTVLITNLHCPSCVTHIEETLEPLSPEPTPVSASIVTQTVTIHHPSSLTASEIKKALEESGFEIDRITQDGADDNALEGDTLASPRPRSSSSRRRSWASARHQGKKDASKETAKHVENCDMCRAELGSSKTDLHSVHVDAGAENLVKASLSISGMTCSSCVSTITDELESKDYVRSVAVNLINNSADVTVQDTSTLDAIVEAIEDIGYGAEVTSTEKVGGERPSTGPELWQGSYAVEGMTCSSCVSTISEALKKVPWIEDFNVSLMLNSASVITKQKDKLSEVVETIEDLGYDAKLTDTAPVKGSQQKQQERKVTIQVDGMHCNRCPERILDMMEATFGDRVHLDKSLTLSEPRLKISYVPDSPRLTIRHILEAISNLDTSFAVSIYHPPSLEERSRKIHHDHKIHIMKKLTLAITAAIPTFIIGVVYMSLLPDGNAGKQYLMEEMWSGHAKRAEWALFIIATPVYFFAADFFHRRCLIELWSIWRPGSKTPIARRFYRFGSMDLLVSLGVTIAYLSSIALLAIDASQPRSEGDSGSGGSYFDAVVFLTMFLLIGRLLEATSKAKAGNALSMLGKLRPTQATLVTESGDAQIIPVDQLDYGDVVRIAHGNSPPFDGTVTEGTSQFDESSLTGESRLVPKEVGDDVFSGTMNKGGPIAIRLTSVSGNSVLDQIIAAVREGQTRRAPVERVADVLTGYFAPVITYLALAVWITWLALGLSGSLPDDYLDVDVGGWPFWSLKFAVAVFVIACPCGIGLAAPTALFVGGGLAAKHGILVKGGGEAFQEASQLDCIVFDKTGTLTHGGEPAITDHKVIFEEDKEAAMGAMKRLEENSTHPIAKAIVKFCNNENTSHVQPTKVDEIPGKGMKGTFSVTTPTARSLEIIIGNEALMEMHSVTVEVHHEQSLDHWKGQGKSVALVATRWADRGTEGWKLWAMLASADPLRPEAEHVIKAFQNRGIQTWMISGDNPKTALAVAEMVGIPKDNVIAGVLPEQKSEKVKYLQKILHKTRDDSFFRGKKGKGQQEEDLSKRAIVAMVGDGINDSPALTAADVGIAIGSGSDIAISSAEFVLVSSELTSLLTLVDLSRMVFRRIKFNFGWALVYNLIALPIAAGVLYPIERNGTHVRLDPVWASLAMALSSVSVVCSSLLMRTRLPLVGFGKRDKKRF